MQKKLETIEINNGMLSNHLQPCSCCGEFPKITVKRWKEKELKGKQIVFTIRCETEACANYRKIKSTDQMVELDFLKDMLRSTEVLISDWNGLMKKQKDFIDTNISKVEEIMLSETDTIPCRYESIVKHIKFHDTEDRFAGRFEGIFKS